MSGQASFQATAPLSPLAVNCQSSLSSINVSDQETWTGTVQGTTATVNVAGTVNGPSSDTITCTNPDGTPQSTTISFPFPYPYSYQSTMDLSKLQSGTPYTVTTGNETETFTSTSGSSTSSNATTTTTATSTSTSNQLPGPATLTSVSGSVSLRPAGGSSFAPISTGSQIRAGDTVITGANSYARVTFPDGTYIALGPHSSFTMPEETSPWMFSLWKGWMHMADTWLNNRFGVHTPTAVAAVRGTNYTLQVLPDNSTFLQVFEGSVALTDIATNATVTLSANQQVTVPSTPNGVSQQNLTASVEQFDPSQVNQWWTSLSAQTNSTQTTSTQTNVNLPLAQIINIQAGQSKSENVPGCANMVLQGSNSQSGAELQAQATGEAAEWVTPSNIDFGYLASGACTQRSYTMSVPPDTPAGTYPLVWMFTCPAGNSSVTCSEGSYNADVVVGGSGSATSSCSTNCLPSGVQVSEEGTVTLVDSNNSPVNVFAAGDIVSTDANSLFGESTTSGGLQIGPSSAVGFLAVSGDEASGFTSNPSGSPFYGTLDQIAGQFNSTLVTDTVLGEMSYLVGAGALSATTTSAPATMLEMARGELHVSGTLQASGGTTCLASSVMIACPTGTDLEGTASVQNNGTSIGDISGSILVASFATGNYVTLQAGQTLFIPSNQAQASQQNLEQSVQPFDQSGTNQWWTALSTQQASGYPLYEYVMGAAVLIAIAAIVVVLLVRRKSKKPAESERVAIPSDTMGAPQTAVHPQVQPEVSMETLDKLSKLKALLDSGAISLEEYERMKAPILNSDA